MPVKMMTPAEAGIPDVGAGYVPPDSSPVSISGKDQRGDDWHWGNLALVAGMTPADLIRYNYKTTIPEVVNFYLQRNCGCKLTTPDGKNLRFPTASPGIVYIPRIPPVAHFFRARIRPMEMIPGAVPGAFEMTAVFQIHLVLNPKLPDPTLFEYRQCIKGRAFQQDGVWIGETWRSRGPLRPIADHFRIPGILPGLQPFFKEDGLISSTGDRYYGHRENGNHSDGLEVDKYLPGPLNGYQYISTDRPGIEGIIQIGQRTSVELDFLGTVVRFDKPVGDTSRKMVETVSTMAWSYKCERTVRIDEPLVPIPTELIPRE